MKLNHKNATLVVWPATIVADGTNQEQSKRDFECWIMEEFGVRAMYEGEFKTWADIDCNGIVIEGTGGRNDLLFWVDDRDIPRFAVPRLAYGMRWYEDYIESENAIVPPEIIERYKDAAPSASVYHEYPVDEIYC